ncbi:hypothetical protein KP509_28G053500 [Ceratopteris richardii]|uniref:Uncharacterized protein n=2 Tax=Ceratopteris richardii TaxID=49495 RepID=A0A8T2RER3_CERRI|nr:hypothetical protein KP509_28G053500 [Ceratopteris richardii]
MAEGDAATSVPAATNEAKKEDRSWALVATHLEAAITAIPRPDWKTITNPKEMAKNLRHLCKALKKQLKEAFDLAKDMSFRVYNLLCQFASKLADLISSFYEYICDKVKRFYKWITGIVQKFKAKFCHAD